MFERVNARQLTDLLLPMGRRAPKGVYFARVCGWDDAVRDGVWAFHEAARQRGVVIEGQIGNPDERQLSYLNDMLGTAFEPNEAFIIDALSRWTPRLSADNRKAFAAALCEQFDILRRAGKNESILRNIYFKMMCWLYYKFERLTPFLGSDEPPRVLYECAGITAHELMLLNILNRMGADILLLLPGGDAGYLKHDPQSRCSQLLVPEGKPFPKDFSLKQLRKDMAAKPKPVPKPVPKPAVEAKPAQPPKAVDPLSCFQKPARTPCTNAWMKEADYTSILTPILSRGDDFSLFYNAYIRLTGVRDRTTYLSDLHQFYQKLKSTGRRVTIADDGLSMPGQDEIAKIRRRNRYRAPGELIVDLAGNLPGGASVELQRLMQRAFVETLQTAGEETHHLLISAVYLLCWIRRYQGDLFQGYRDGDVPCFILMGGCKNAHDALYMRFLSRLPVDVLILAPDLNRPCALKDKDLLELTGKESLQVERFPRDAGSMQVRTLAAHAEDELTETLYADSGMYRARQFKRAEALTLQTTYDELFILWRQELKYRPGFAAQAQTVTMPVLYAKVSGVEGGKPDAYWQEIRRLIDKDTLVYKRFPVIAQNAPNPYQSLAVKAVRDGRIRRSTLTEDRLYPFSMLRGELQSHMLDKLQLMLDRRMIRGTFERGVEYTVVSTVLNLDKRVVRLLQSFDFAKDNPKLICISTDDQGASLEDTILLTFLNLVGFDIALFVPTGYQVIERFLNDNLPVEHQAGDYLYDLTVPDFDTLPLPRPRSWLDNLLRRGNN